MKFADTKKPTGINGGSWLEECTTGETTFEEQSTDELKLL